ncbi:hypothetical protein MMC22_004655, partial [Lobaria immixta]|nr:hypothetical protein [Lobaria immixta]
HTSCPPPPYHSHDPEHGHYHGHDPELGHYHGHHPELGPHHGHHPELGPHHGHDPEQGEDHDHDHDDDSFLDDTGHDDDAIYLRRNSLWAHRSPLELAFGILALGAMIVFIICFCVTAVVITFSAIRNS